MIAPLLQLQDVSLCLPNGGREILSHITYEVQRGDFVVILGSNGSGKSSLLKLLDRRYRATSGHLLLENKALGSFAARPFAQAVRTLTQDCHDSLFVSMSIFENYLLICEQFQARFHFIRRKHARLRLAAYLEPFNEKLANNLDQCVADLSGGEKQTLALALAVCYPPRILLLDEHTSALDPLTAERLLLLTRDVVAQHGMTCLMTTHDLVLAEGCGNRILALRNGRIYQTIEAVEKRALNQQQLLAACY